MIDGIDFSGLGAAPTDFEVRLLRQSTSEIPWAQVGQRLIHELGASAGARALTLVLDELSCAEAGMKVWVPTRRVFFAALWRAERDALVRDLVSRPGWTHQDVADALGISRTLVHKIAQGVTAAAQCGDRGVR